MCCDMIESMEGVCVCYFCCCCLIYFGEEKKKERCTNKAVFFFPLAMFANGEHLYKLHAHQYEQEEHGSVVICFFEELLHTRRRIYSLNYVELHTLTLASDLFSSFFFFVLLALV